MKATDTPFIRQWLAVVAASLFAVVVCAFVFVPMSLGYHPGDQATVHGQHMT